MKSSQSSSEPASATKPAPYCAFPGCKVPPTKTFSQNLGARSSPPISSFDVGIYSNSIGDHGVWPTSYKNLRQLASGEGFNEYFQNQFNGNESTYLRWKEVFDVLEIVGGMGYHRNVRVNLEAQVLTITRSEDLVKLRALAKLCSPEFFHD
ncbi:hypothetical protein TrLO_g14506 [Triparma laevis f. longispina]|uniref:Uncharacterized protein n=1 Tax=Triparma laevis f. longispina TaxID=1714387 RepID=A0A9W7A4M4_9STRA|nr:hypothetical protein TrLO_g14506 [Triparma laevis f. longispina]